MAMQQPSGKAHATSIYAFGEAYVAVSGPADAMSAADRILARLIKKPSSHPLSLSLDIVRGDTWNIVGSNGVRRHLPRSLSLPLLVDAVVEIAAESVASGLEASVLSGIVLAYEGRGLAIVGDDRDSALVLALHLHARGWSTVSFSKSFVESDARALSIPTLPSISSTSIDSLPAAYRSAIEVAPWVSHEHELMFYAVDPMSKQARWRESVRLDDLLVLDGAVESEPRIEAFAGTHDARFLGRDQQRSEVRGNRLTLGKFIPTCDLVERWFAEASQSA